MFKWFQRKKKSAKHVLKDVSGLPQYKDFYRPVKCSVCRKQFLMDVFGGWAVEFDFTMTEKFGLVTQDSLKDAITLMHTIPAKDWIQLEEAECEGSGR